MEGIRLIGTEEVTRAGHTILAAADSMKQTFNWQAEAMERQSLFMNEWLQRFENALQSHVDQLRDLKEE